MKVDSSGVALDVLVRDAPGDAGAASIPQLLLQPIVENACSYGSSTVQIRIVPISQSRVQLHISDDGSGIGDEERERIFDPGYRGSAGDSTGNPFAAWRSSASANPSPVTPVGHEVLA